MLGCLVKVLGGGGEVGRLSVLVRRESSKQAVVLDAGVNFDEEDKPIFAATYPPRYVESIIISHAHLDHIGSAPLYFISGSPRVYATRPTRDMARLMLYDFLKLNGYYSPYEQREVEALLDSTELVSYGERREVGDGFEASFYSAGHIPGSMITVLECDGERIAFTGDVNTIETKLMKPAQHREIGRVDILIMEATYGASRHPPRQRAEERLVSIIEEVLDKKGTVLIPSFSIARGQEIMSILASRGVDAPVYIDGMVRKITEIFLENPGYINNPDLLKKAYEEFNIVKGWRDRRRAWRGPSIIIASAGMLKGGPSLYYLKRIGRDKKNAVVMVSYQAPGSPGRRILEEGLMPGTEEPVEARIEWLDFSSHGDRESLAEIVEATKPSKLIIVHSEPDVAKSFADYVREKGLAEDVVIAANEEEYKV